MDVNQLAHSISHISLGRASCGSEIEKKFVESLEKEILESSLFEGKNLATEDYERILSSFKKNFLDEFMDQKSKIIGDKITREQFWRTLDVNELIKEFDKKKISGINVEGNVVEILKKEKIEDSHSEDNLPKEDLKTIVKSLFEKVQKVLVQEIYKDTEIDLEEIKEKNLPVWFIVTGVSFVLAIVLLIFYALTNDSKHSTSTNRKSTPNK